MAIPLAARVIGCGVGLAVTASLLVRSLMTGRAGQGYDSRPVDRKANTFSFWASLGIGTGFFLAAVVLGSRGLLSR